MKTIMRSCCKALLAMQLCAGVGAQWPAWTEHTTSVRPPDYDEARTLITYDAARQQIVLLGPGTWLWDGNRWELRWRTALPPEGGVMAYDAARQVVVWFGPAASSTETWIWNGTFWAQLHPTRSPPGDEGLAMAYDEELERIVLVGPGTWLWDGAEWQEMSGGDGPTGPGNMAYDRARHQIIWMPYPEPPIYGSTRAETWIMDSRGWSRCLSQSAPSGRARFGLTYDEAAERIVLYGGDAWYCHSWGYGVWPLGDTWEWDGREWVERATDFTTWGYPWGPGPATLLAYFAPQRETLLYFSSCGYLLTFGSEHRASHSSFARGCVGTGSGPTLASGHETYNGLHTFPLFPYLGTDFTLELRNLSPGRSTLLWIGASREQANGLPLPIDLGPLGMPGCALHVAPDITIPVFNVGGQADVTIALPNEPRMIGMRFYDQALTLDPTANALGAVLSNACEGRFGIL
jgi:hypothetical protein